MAKCAKIYGTTALLVAVGLAVWVLNDGFGMILPFGDGHGPDSGTLEYLHAQERRRQHLPVDVMRLALVWMGSSAVVAVAFQIVQRALAHRRHL